MSASEYATPAPAEVATIEDLKTAVEFFDGLRAYLNDTLLFRGHTDITWPIVPSIFRQQKPVIAHESDIIRELISLYPNEFTGDATMFDRLVRMQHFGLPTRLMDQTRDPLVALYFAVEEGDNNTSDGSVIITNVPPDRRKYFDSDSVSCLANLSNLSEQERVTIENTTATTISDLHRIQAVDRLFQFIRVEKPHFMPRIRKEDLFKPYYVVPKMNNARIIAQSGAFIIFGLSWKKGPKYKRGITAECIRIPARSKRGIRDSLERLGYDDSSLFPEIERASRQVVKRFAKLGP